MHRRTLMMFMASSALSIPVVFPALGAAQDATPSGSPSPTDSTCVPMEDGSGCLPTAPDSERVDLAEPTFSDPTSITNPLFPISTLTQVIQLGVDASEPLRVEATLLPETKTIAWNGEQVETVVSQFIAYLDSRVVEVATDFFAQADDGSVWYFGEDVFNYEEGVIANTDGTWLAGVDGPPGMIMPGKPRVGDVYRPENIPGFVFEEVTVKAIDQTVDGPRGPVEGAIVIEELLMDGTLEEKVFAPGYGEFLARTETEFIILALAVPMDAQTGGAPAALSTLATGSTTIFNALLAEEWDVSAANLAEMTIAWDTYDSGDVPQALATRMDSAFDALKEGVDARAADDARQAAIDVGRASLDLQLQYLSLAQIDVARLGRAADQIQLDSAAGDAGAVAGDVVVAETIWARVAHSVEQSMAEQIGAEVANLRAAVDAGDLTAAAESSAQLRDLLDAESPSS